MILLHVVLFKFRGVIYSCTSTLGEETVVWMKLAEELEDRNLV
jgi:hypothetical protein